MQFDMNRTILLLAALTVAGGASFVLAATPSGSANASERPNILIVIADDATFHELPLFGGKNIVTPNVDRLASEGMTFRRAYVSMSMCVPCRAEMYTGLYPMHSGVCWNHMPTQPGIRSIVQHLSKLGYRVGLAGKVHATPRAVYPFEMVDGFERNCVALTADYDCKGIKEFMARDATHPFCLVVASVLPHAPWTVGDWQHFKPAKFVLPPYIVDTPATRQALARYYAEYEALDKQLGDVLKTLEETGKANKTLTLFTSEQGGQWPGAKWTNWEEGLHTALIVRWPDHIKPGSQTEALIQYADVLPTLIDAAGGDSAAGKFDGSSFLSVLKGQTNAHRKYAYAMHNNIPEGPPYPIRSIHDGHYHYIRNLTPETLYIEKHVMASPDGPYWQSWVWRTAETERAMRLVTRYMRRPAEQFYDVEKDPFEMTNLANDSKYSAEKAALSAELDRWLHAQGDPGASIDTAQTFEEYKVRAVGRRAASKTATD
jgi:uncharacterized sulfatase